MSIKQFIKKTLTGISIPREYCCIDRNSLRHTFSVYARIGHTKFDVTNTHIFLGYKPLIMALPFSKNSEAHTVLGRSDKVVLDFQFKPNVSTDPDEKMTQPVAHSSFID